MPFAFFSVIARGVLDRLDGYGLDLGSQVIDLVCAVTGEVVVASSASAPAAWAIRKIVMALRYLQPEFPMQILSPVLAAAATVAVVLAGHPLPSARAQPAIPAAWPGGASMALSLSFDDGRESQLTEGLPVFARHGARVTLYVVPSAVERKLDSWKQATAAGHENR